MLKAIKTYCEIVSIKTAIAEFIAISLFMVALVFFMAMVTA